MAKDRISITINSDIKERLEVEATAQRRSMSSLIEFIADEYTKNKESK